MEKSSDSYLMIILRGGRRMTLESFDEKIATSCRAWNIEQLFLLALYGIGWVFWDNQFVEIILEPRRYANRVDTLLDYLLNERLRKIINDTIDRKMDTMQKKLEEWVDKKKLK